MRKGYHLSMESIRKGYLFCQKWCIKGKGSHLGTEPPRIKLFQYPPLGQNVILKLVSVFVFFVFILVYHFGFLVCQFHADREISLLSRKKFCKRKLSCTRLDFGEILLREQNGNPERAVSFHLARSGSQSEHRVRSILPARGSCHMMSTYSILLFLFKEERHFSVLKNNFTNEQKWKKLIVTMIHTVPLVKQAKKK